MLGPGHAAMLKPLQPSAYWGDEQIWDTHINNHNSMIDGKGRMWLAASVRGSRKPGVLPEGLGPSRRRKAFPLAESHRQLADARPEDDEIHLRRHLLHHPPPRFADDANDTRVGSSGGGSGAVGWFNTKLFDETGDAAKAQGWTPLILDTNGNGKRDEATSQPNQPVDPTKDKRIGPGVLRGDGEPGRRFGVGHAAHEPRLDRAARPGLRPADTALAEIYNIPMPGFGPRGADIDSKGVVWVSLASGHIGSFDRRKCKGPLNGPTATGNHCPEGWSFYQYPGPGFDGIGENSAPSRATIPGSTSTTPSVSATTCRCRPATSMTA